MTELLPCPFCGGRAIFGKSRLGWQVHCEACCAGTDFGPELDPSAITAWNTRPAPSADVEALAALEWYAEHVAGCRKLGSIGDPFRYALDQDGGKRARAAIAAMSARPDDERAAVVEWLRRWAIGSGWVHGKTPGEAWENGLREAADAIERGEHRRKP